METPEQRAAEDRTPPDSQVEGSLTHSHKPQPDPDAAKTPVRDHFLHRLAAWLVQKAFGFERWVCSKTGKGLIRVDSVTFIDPMGTPADDPRHACFEFSWNDAFLKFLWDNGYQPGLHPDIKDLEEHQLVDAWLLDCYRNAVFESDQQGSAVQEVPTEPGFTRQVIKEHGRHPDADSAWLWDETGPDPAPLHPGGDRRWRNTPDMAVDATTRAEKEAWPGGTPIDLGK